MKLVVLGLSLSSSWGNGHATTYRALLKSFAGRGHEVLFLERDAPWYRDNRDCPKPDYCHLEFYRSLDELEKWRGEIESADAVIVGSYVPDGVEVARFVQKHARGVAAFYDIDTPVTLAKLERGDFEYLSPDLIPNFDLYLSFTGGPTLGRIESEFGSPAARALYCSVDAEAYVPRYLPKTWDLSYLGTYSPDRQPTLEKLLIEPARRLPELKFVVAGPQYPEDIHWPENVERINHLPPDEHADFYAASRFTLNVTRADMIAAGWSPSVRLFEAAACATPVISDRWDGLDRLFEPGREILLADSSYDVAKLLANPQSAVGIGDAARRRVLAEDSSSHRAAQLQRLLEDAAERRFRAPRAKPREYEVKNGTERVALVTGGAGFIGSHLCDRLIEQGARVVCLDNFLTGRRSNIAHLEDEPRFELVDHDVITELPARIRRMHFTHIYHLACAASPPHYQADPEHTMLTNVVGTRNMLRLAEESSARLLLTSTSEVYGDPEVHPQPEEYRGWVNCTGPRACYDEGKRAAETLAFDYRRSGRAEIRVARIFNTYGPRMRADDGRVVSNVICQALAGDDITVYGDGLQTRSFCYVDDLVSGLLLLMDSDRADGMPVNLGNRNEMTVKELVQQVKEMTGSSSKIVRRPLPEDDPKRRRPNIARAKTLLGWQPHVSLREGLEETIRWFDQERRSKRPPWRGIAAPELEAPLIQAAE